MDVTLSESQDELNIIIEDNGKGIPREIAETFNNPKTACRDDKASIGLHNAFSRMRMYYGNRASWNVSSIPGVGTIVTLIIPVGGKERGDR